MLALQVTLNGILLGGLYSLMAVGMSLIWGVMNIVNLAHGALIMLGAYVTYWIFTLYGVDPFLSVPLTMAVMFGLGYALQKFLINLVVRAQLFITLLLTFGIDIVLVNLAQLVWSANLRQVNPPYAGANLEFLGLTIPYVRLMAFGVAVIISVALFILMERTKLGRAIRATSQDLVAARLVGVKVGSVYALTYGIGSALAGAAGALFGMLFPITPNMGGALTLKSFVVAVLGGLGTTAGSVAGGLVLGLAEDIGSTLWGPTYRDIISFGLLVLLLVLRPEGLVRRRRA